MFKEALLYEKLKDGNVRCGVCQRRCLIGPNQVGFCKTRLNQDGELYTLIYGVVSAVNIDPIEKKPVYHFKPGSRCYSLGTFGCNFRCDFCQNWDISYADMSQLKSKACPESFSADSADQDKLRRRIKGQNLKTYTPKQAVVDAGREKCQGIAFTYNEPTIWLEYTMDVARLAKKKGLYTVYVTNGYLTSEALDRIGPHLDVFRVDIKSMDDEFYQKLIRVPEMEGILAVTKRAKEKWKMHVEIVTNLIPAWNDSETNLQKTANWICENLGELTPWHITRFFPCANLQNVPPTPLETLKKAVAIGREAGLKYIYLGNVRENEFSDTFCPQCRKLLIRRNGYDVAVLGLDKKGRCSSCQSVTNVII